jgi:phage gp29-like protein
MFLFDAMDGVGHGYSCQEIEWHQLGNLWLPKSFEHINPRNFMTLTINQMSCDSMMDQ